MSLRPRAWGVVVVLGLAGCDMTFGITHLNGPPEVAYADHLIIDPNGDFDMDMVPNGMDPCPLDPVDVAGNAHDADMDGVPDVCDPNPNTPGDCLVLFDDFGDPTISPHWGHEGVDIFRDVDLSNLPFLGFFHSSDELIFLDVPLDLDAVTVLGYVQEGDQEPTSTGRHAVEIYVDLTQTPTANGTACGLESDLPPAKVAAVKTTAGIDQDTATAVVGPERVGTSTDFELDWSPHDLGTPTCKGRLKDPSNEDKNAVADAMPASRIFALRGIEVGLQIHAIAGWGHSCSTPTR